MTESPVQPPRRWTASTGLRLFIILLLALAVRLIAINTRILWYDEAFAVLFSEKGLDAMLYGTLTPVNGAAADVHPLAYYTALDGWMRLAGQSPAAVRLFSVILGLATIGAVFLVARELFDEKIALAAAFVTALMPFHVQYSQEVRMYALLGLLLMLTTWCFLVAVKSGKLLAWLGFGVLAGLSMYAQQLAAFYLAALGLIPFLLRRRDLIVRTILASSLAVLIYLPWLVNLPSQLGKVGVYWIAKPSLPSLLLAVWAFLFVELEVTAPVALFVSILSLSLIVIFLLLRTSQASRMKRTERQSLWIALWLVVAPLVLMWLFSQVRPVFLIRGLQGSALALYICVAWLLLDARVPRLFRALIGLAWIASCVVGLYYLFTWNTFPRPRFDLAWKSITAQADTVGTRVVHANKITMLPMVYYAHLAHSTAPEQHYIRDVEGSGEDTLGLPTQQALGLLADQCVAQAAGGADQVWFVIFKQQISDEGGSSPAMQWLDAHYRHLSDIPVNDLLLVLYDQPDAVAKAARCE
ncbi:MAG: glycosyltransferase family 39 protein [Anaerolineae bacterium]|nr:glycosyltransferase family 39 protein [Anaerolineae bacterium]